MVAIGLMSFVMTLAGSAIFQALASNGLAQAETIATKDLRHAMSYYGLDAARAETVDLSDGGGPVTSLVITWTDGDGTLQTSTFSQAGDTFTRDVAGVTRILARNVTTVAFDRTGKTLELDLTVSTPPDGAKTQSLRVHAGRLP